VSPRCACLSALLITLTATGLGRAQPAEPEITPPRVLKAEPPEPQATEAAILLELLIGEDGRVREADIIEGVSNDLDSAALEAVRRFEFEPARRRGVPVPVRIRYRYVFPAAPKAPVPVPAKPVPVPVPVPAKPKPVPVPEPEPEYGATAEIEAPPRGVTRRSLKADEAMRVPGATGDALLAVETLPGVARSGAYDDPAPVLRGAAQHESQVFLEGTPVPNLFHLGGMASFFQPRLLDRVELHAGNFSTRYGRATGGIVEVEVRDPKADRLHAMLQLSVMDSSALVEGPLGDEASVALAARRSNVDFFFEQFVPEDAYSVVAAPTYYDYQAIGALALARRHRLRLMVYGSRDSLELFFADPVDEDPTLRGTVGGSVAFHRVSAALSSRFSRDLSHELSVTAGLFDADLRFGPLFQELDAKQVYGRSEWTVDASPSLRLHAGLDLAGEFASGRYFGPQPTGLEGDPNGDASLSQSGHVNAEDDDLMTIATAAYVEMLLRPSESVLLVPGVRVDYFDNIGVWTIDPRLSVRSELSEATAVKAGVGLFTQPPEYYQVLPEIGNPELRPYHALQFSAGHEHEIASGVELGLEGFYKRLFNRVVPTAGSRPPGFINDGSGRIYGAELSAELRPSSKTYGYLAYTLSRSERQDRNEPWRLFDRDQTHVLSAVAMQRLGRGWEIGARFRLVSGNPQTPVLAAVYDARIGQYRPVFGAVNSERESFFHQLDLRVEKIWQLGAVSLAAFVEVINAYNAQNAEGKRQSFDYSEEETVTGLPLFPNLGIRGEL
jgi:TonB family protein